MVEVTESSLFADIDLARTIVTSLKNQGIRLALDDFGTGFSSLSHLRSLPFDIIKIDRSFVTNINAKRESAAIVRAVTTLAGALAGAGLRRGHRGRGDLRSRRPARLRRSARAGISASRCPPSRRASCSTARRAATSRAAAQRRQRLNIRREMLTGRPAAGRREPLAALREL